MSDNSKINIKSPSTRSVLSFLFLPEFKRSLPAFAHIGPIFIRTIAIMFVQAGLLRPNHPSMMYGLARDIPDFKFSDLIGEAWYNLRVNDGNGPYQYGMFVGVIMMLCLTVVSGFMFILNLFLSSAQAQIFAHPTIGTEVSDAAASTGGVFQLNPTSSDLAIDILNKVVRQSAYGEGAPLSVALGGVMGLYNTALLVIASLVVFWAILSIIIDTARTGQIGGGRHSIVWVPIRFVFALALMIPLGTGFSGGQLITLKIAEWGSNLGTNGWVAYVDNLTDASLVANKPVPMDSAVELVVGLARIETCRLTYNTLNAQAGSSSNMIKYKYEGWFAGENDFPRLPQPWKGRKEAKLYVGNGSVPDYCGVLTVENSDPNVFVNMSDLGNFGTVLINAKSMSKQAHNDAFFNILPDYAERIGCGISHEYNSFGSPGCSSFNTTFADGVMPESDLIETAATQYYNAVKTVGDAAYQSIVDYIGDPNFLIDMKNQGWAGMGVWYFKIQQMNQAMDAILTPSVNIKSGSLELHSRGNIISSLFKDKENDEVLNSTSQTMQKYDEWWLTQAIEADGTSVVSGYALSNKRSATSQNVVTGGDGQFNDVMSEVFRDFTIIEFGQQNLYPMTELIMLGEQMFNMALGGYAALAVVSAAATGTASSGVPGLSAVGGAVKGVLESPVGGLIGMMLGLMMGSGLLLKFYVPIVPWIRVTFAVLAWIVSVFEAVIVVPLLALANLSTEGEGLFTQTARNLWVSSLHIILRPILTVIGFVAALLIFNSMVVYVNQTYNIVLNLNGYGRGFLVFLSIIVYSVIYVVVIYSLVNSTFKIVDALPNAVMRWMGGPQDDSYHDSNMEGYIIAASRFGEKGAEGLTKGAIGGGSRAATGAKNMAQKLKTSSTSKPSD